MTRRYVARFLVRRLATAAVLVVLISIGTFSLLALAPGDPIDALLAGQPRTPAVVTSLREEYDLNGSLPARYWRWARRAIHLDFGQSVSTHDPVVYALESRAPLTLELTGFAFVLVMLTGVPLGMLAATRAGRLIDRGIVGLTVAGVSVPAFVMGILLIYLFAVTLHVLPSFGSGTGSGRIGHLVLPACSLALATLAVVVKVTRTAMVRELDQDYVVFARARGQSEWEVLRGALRNALIPVITAAGLILGSMFVGAVLVEQVFGLLGLGSLLVTAANQKDLPTLQGVVLLVGTAIIVLNLLTDLLYLVVDPRVRFGESR